MPAISVLIKPASGSCNMRCDYCFYADESSKRDQQFYGMMSEDTIKNVIRRTILRAEGVVSYAFQGGEPTLRGLDFFREVIRLQKKYNRNGVRVQNALQTNGMLIDDEWCKFFKENNFLIGLSIDGTQEIHDSMRHTSAGEKTFDRINHSAELFDKWGVEYNILTVVTPEIARNIGDIYSSYKKRGWYYQQYIACLDPLDEPRGQNHFSIQPLDYGKFLADLFDLWYEDVMRERREAGSRKSAAERKSSVPYIRQFDNYVGIEMGYKPEACDMCGICSTQYVVEADGSVYPCDFYALDEYKLGNFNEDLLDQLDAKRKEIGFIERSWKLDPECKECQYFKLCRGGCQRNREWNGDIGVYQNYFCEGYKLFFDRCAERMKELGRGG